MGIFSPPFGIARLMGNCCQTIFIFVSNSILFFFNKIDIRGEHFPQCFIIRSIKLASVDMLCESGFIWKECIDGK